MNIDLVQIHLWTLLATAVVILFADHEGFSYMRGKKQMLNLKLTQFLHYAVWAGLLTMIGTGFFLALPAWRYYLTDTVFLIKMCAVAVLVGNAVFIGKLMPIASIRPFAELSQKEKQTLFVSGALSTVCWITAASMGYFYL